MTLLRVAQRIIHETLEYWPNTNKNIEVSSVMQLINRYKTDL